MNNALWIVAWLLAVLFLASGAAKLLLTKEKQSALGLKWVDDFSAGAVKAIGATEVAAVVALILPAMLNVAPILVPLAAVGLVLLMVGAIATHLRRHEAKLIGAPILLLALAAFLAVARFGPVSFSG